MTKNRWLLSTLLFALMCVEMSTVCAGENVLRASFAAPEAMELRPASVRRKRQESASDLSPQNEEPAAAAEAREGLSRIPPPVIKLEEEPSCGFEDESPTSKMEFGQMHRPHSHFQPTMLDRVWFRCRERMHQVHQVLALAWEPHRDPNDPDRHWGIGDPLVGTSWRNRPWYVNGFLGGVIGDELQQGLVDQGGGFFIGARLGGDFHHYWGCETRVAFSDVNVTYPTVTRAGQSNLSFFDASLLYYPLGDTRWRPYFSLGFGVGGYKYTTVDGKALHASAIGMPFGCGLKYLFSRQFALRFDVTDNFTWPSGSHSDALHNISFTGGLEFHFGGKTVSYDPW